MIRLKPIYWHEVEAPGWFKPNVDLKFVQNIGIYKDEEYAGVVSLAIAAEDPHSCVLQMYVKPKFRGRVFTKQFFKQIYAICFDAFGFETMLAKCDNPLMANILERINWNKIEQYHYIQRGMIKHGKHI